MLFREGYPLLGKTRGTKILIDQSPLSSHCVAIVFVNNSCLMTVGKRIRSLRQQRGLSQGDVERKTGMLRCYISRTENNHLVPSLESLEKFAQALEVPLYLFFYEGEDTQISPRTDDRIPWQMDNRMRQFARIVRQLGPTERQVLLRTAERLSKA